MTRRSVFVDKLKAFSFVFADEAVTTHAGNWQRLFQQRNDNPPPVAGGDANRDGGVRMKDEVQPLSFFPHPSSLLLEIGCYNAEFLSRVAARYPHTNFIGLDWKARPLYLGAQRIAEQSLPNLALLHARAQNLAAVFADGELDEIWLFHPDPFDNERERAMRLMSERFLADVHRLLKPGGRFIFKTDHSEYFDATLSLLAGHHGFDTEICTRDFWLDQQAQMRTADARFAGETTFFEQRFLRRRQPIHFLQIKRGDCFD